MAISKDELIPGSDPSFRPEYLEEYEGYQFAISLSYHGTRDVNILFPKEIDVDNYVDKGVTRKKITYIEKNWFYKLIRDVFTPLGADAGHLSTNRSMLCIRNIGMMENENSVLMVREVDWAAAAEKYAEDFKELPDIKAQFDKFREFHNEIERKVDADDHEGWSHLVPPGVNEVIDLSQDDIIKMCHDFIDEMIAHKTCAEKHSSLLKTLKSSTKKVDRRKRK